jgi:hypothetical protein
VQTFAGPGVLRDVEDPSEAASPLPSAEHALVAASLLNEARALNDLPLLEVSPPLVSAARTLLPDDPAGGLVLGGGGELIAAVPPERRSDWGALAVGAGTCAGCGSKPTEADLRFFRDRWLDDERNRQTLLDPTFTRMGLAMQADGEGGKAVVAVFGAPR